MHQSRSVTDRRRARHGPPFASTQAYQRHVESQLLFRVVRATDAVPGSKSWREKRARTGDRVPFHTECEIVRAVLARGVACGDPALLEHAIDEVWDLVVEFTRLVSRLATDARARVGAADPRRAA